MATAAAAKTQDFIFEWEGKDKNGKVVRGEMRAGGEAVVSASLRGRSKEASSKEASATSVRDPIPMRWPEVITHRSGTS